jgi:hypothetical protein
LPRRTRRTGGLALALCFLVSQLAGFLHLATERHEVCADHGELVHAGPEAGGHAHAPEAGGRAHTAVSAADPHDHASAPGGERGPLLEGGAGASTGAHAHCGLLPVLDPRQRPPEASSAEPAPLVFTALQVGGPRPAHASVPLLLRAPKQSPPA